LLFLSNGHGEDLIALQVLQSLHGLFPDLQLEVFPLVGKGKVFDSAISEGWLSKVGPSITLPSGGFSNQSVLGLFSDISAGLCKLTCQQWRFVRSCDVSLCAARPPLEALRLILSLAVTTRQHNESWKIMTNDVSRAFFYAPIQEGQHIYVQLPAEDMLPGEEDMCGKLNFSMYGTRRAATNWQAHYTNVLKKIGFSVGVANNCTFYHPQKLIQCMVHGDDFISTGPSSSPKWLEKSLSAEFKIKTNL